MSDHPYWNAVEKKLFKLFLIIFCSGVLSGSSMLLLSAFLKNDIAGIIGWVLIGLAFVSYVLAFFLALLIELVKFVVNVDWCEKIQESDFDAVSHELHDCAQNGGEMCDACRGYLTNYNR